MKKNLTILLTAIMFVVILAPSAYAIAKEDNPVGVKASIEGYRTSNDIEKVKDPNLQIDIIYTPSSNLFIDRMTSSIHDIGRGYVNMQANTKTFSTVDRLNLTMYLEVWDGLSWKVVDSWFSNETNTNSINLNTTSSVNSGDTYRVRTSHVAIYNGSSESKQTITSYITIS